MPPDGCYRWRRDGKPGHTKMLHDFDAGLMYEEPFLYVNMKGPALLQ
jgi:hypothetical protein